MSALLMLLRQAGEAARHDGAPGAPAGSARPAEPAARSPLDRTIRDVAGRLAPRARREAVTAEPPAGLGPVATALARYLARHGDTGDRLALASARSLDPEIADLLLRAPEPAVRVAACRHPDTPRHLIRELLARDAPAEITAMLKGVRRNRRLLAPALTAADPELAAHAARVVRGPRRAAPPHDPAAVHAWLRSSRPPAPPRPGTAPVPRARRARARIAATRLDAWSAGQWAVFTRLHAADPIDPVTAALVAAAPGCPPETALALAFTELPGHPEPVFPDAALHGLRTGRFTLADVVTRAPGATAVLSLLPRLWRDPAARTAGPHAGPAAARALLTDLVTGLLGADPARWAGLVSLLDGRCTGTLPELLAGAARTPPPAAPLPPGSPAGPRLVPLLRLVPDETYPAILSAPAVVEALAGAVADTARRERLPDALIAAYVAVAPEEARVDLGRRGAHLTTAEFLWSLDDPAANLGLARGYGLPPGIRRRVLTGTSAATGRPGTLPVHPGITAGDPPHKSGVLLADAEHVTAVLTANTHLCAVYQAEGLRRLLELDRADLVTGLLPRMRPEITEAVRGPLAEGDLAAAAGALDDVVRAAFRRDLVQGRTGELPCHIELGVADWPLVARLLDRGGLPAVTVRALGKAASPGMPDDLARTLLAAAPDTTGPKVIARSPEFARAALAACPLPPLAHVLGPALEAGVTTWAEVVALGRPARAVLALLAAHAPEPMPAIGPAPAGEALVVAASLLDDFAGTLPELYATARAIAGAPPAS